MNFNFIDFAKDAIENMEIACNQQGEPHNSGYIVVAFDAEANRATASYAGKISRIVDSICDAIEQTEQGWQIMEKVMDELERRMEARAKETTNKI